MAGEDVLIRVGVDYSAAIASTRQFEQELRRILASSAQSAVASAAATTSAALSASTTNRGALPQQAAGQLSAVPDYTRELTSINKNLEILVQLTRSNTNRTVIFSEGPRTTPVAVSAPPPVVTTSSTPRPVAAPVAPPRPVQVARPTPVASFANDRAARELATAQTAYANTLRQLATRAVAPVQVAAPAPVSHVAPRALPQPTTRVLDTTPVQTAMASVVAELNKVRQPSQVSGAAIAAQLSAEMTPFRVMMTSLTAAMSSARASVAQLSAASAGAGRVLEAVGARSGGSTGPSGSSFGGSGSPPPPPIPPQPSSPPPQPPPSPRGLSSGPTPLGLPSGDWQSPWIGEFDEALKRRVNGWIKQRVAEVGQGPSGTPIATPWVHPTVSWSQPIQGNLGPIRPDLVMPPVRTMLGPGPEVSRPVIDATATQRSQELVLAQRDYATSLRRASDTINQQAARYIDLKTIQRPPTDLLGLGPGRFAGKTSEAAGRRGLPSSGQTYPMPAGPYPGDLPLSQWLQRPDVYYHVTAVEGWDQGDVTHFGTRRQAQNLARARYVSPYWRESLTDDGFDVTDPRLYTRRIPSSKLDSEVFSDETANAAQLAFAVDHGNFSEIRGSIKDSLPDWMVDAAESIDSWMEGAEDAFEDILGVPGVRDALSALENQRGIVYNNVAEGPGTSLAVPPGVVGTSYLEDILASPNRPESLKEAIRALGQPEYGPYFPLEGRQFSHTPEVSGLRYGPVADLLGMGGDNLPVLARQQQLLDRQIAYETAAVRGPSSGQIPLPTQSVTLRDRLALDSGKESRASAEIVLAKDGLAAEYRRVAKQLRAKAELEARSVLPSSGKPIVPSSDRSKIKGIPREVSDWILRNSGPNDTFSADELVDAYHASRKYRDRIKAEAGQVYGDELWERKLSGETYWGYAVSREAVLLAGGGAGGIPPSPPRIGSGFGDEDDDEVRRLKAQLAAALRQRIQALNAETEGSGVADPEIIAANQARRNYQRFVALDEAQEARRRGDDQAYRGLVASAVPKGAERARFMLSNDPFGYGGFEQELLRDIGAQRRALNAPSADFVPRDQQARLDRLALPASTTYGPEYRKPVSYQPQQPTHGPIKIGDESWQSRERAAHRARNTASSESPPLGLRWRQTSEGVFQGYFGQGKDAEPIPVRYERVREDGKVTGTRVISSEGERFFPGHQSVAEAKLYAESLESVRKATEDARASTVRAAADERRRTEQRASGIFDSEIVRDASTKRVSDTEFAAAVDKDISGDPELDNRKTQADADRKSDRHDRTQKTDKELIDRGEEEKISKSQRKKLGAMLPEEEIADFEQRATKFSKAVGRITDQDLKTPEGQGVLQALGEHGQRLRAEMEGVIAPEGDGVLAESLYRSRKLVDSGISDVDFASERKETRATAEAREAAEARRATQAEAAAARKRFLNESPAGQMQNLKGYLGALREEMGSLRVNPDITAAKQKFAELSALLSALEEKAAGIEVDPEDGRAVENYAKLRSGIQQQRANLESIGSQLGQRETFAKYEQDMAAWRQARAGRSAGRKLTDWFTMRSTDEPVMPEGYAPTGGGRGGGGGFDGGGPGGLGGADGPNDRRGFSRFLYNARHRGGALGFFETGALSTLRYGLPSMAMYGAMSGISNATREAEEFRFTMEKVRAQLADTFGSGSDQIFEHFKNNILDLSKETGVQADVLASLGMQFQGAFGSETIGGLSGQALVESQLQAAAKLSQVTKIPAAELTDGLTAASFGFNRTNEDISNVALRLESLSGVTAKETIGFIGDIAPVATEAGFSLEELASMAAIAQQKSGRSGAALAESFGRIIPAISNSKDKLLELADADKALQAPEFLKALSGGDIKTTLLFLVKNFQNLTKSSQDFVVTALGGRREAQALLAAVGDQGQLDKYISGAEDSDGTLEARFKSAQSTLTVQMQRLRQEFNLFVASLLESGLADVLSGLVAAVSLLVKGFEAILTISGGINDFFGGLPGKIMGVVAAIVAMRVALGFISKSGGGLIRSAFEIPKEATIRGTLANTASGVWAGTRQGGLLGALSGRIGAARAAYTGATAASAAAGTGGVGAAASGLGAAVTAFTGVSATALAAGGLALGALAGTYLMIRRGVEQHAEEAKNIANWARDSKTSAEDIQNLIDSPESDGGPGIWTSIGGWIKGERYLGVRDQYRAELARKKITSSERKQIEGLSSSSAEEQIDELITDTIDIKIPDTNKAYRTPDERRDARREASVAKKRKKETTKDVRDLFDSFYRGGSSAVTQLENRRLEQESESTTIWGNIQHLAGRDVDYSEDTFSSTDKLIGDFAKLAGVKKKSLTGAVAKALASGKAKEELQKIIDDEEEFTKDEVTQAKAALLSLAKGDKDIDTEVKVSKSSQTIETITKNYKAGVIGYNTYVQRVKENLETLRNNIAVTGGTDEQRQRQAQLIAELSQEISQKAVDATQMQLDNFQTTSGAAPETMAKARVMQYSALIKSGKLSGEQRLEVVKQLFQAQRDLLTKAIENADSGAEVEKIVAEGARIDPETRVNAIIGGISKLNGNWVTFTETFRTIFGESAGAYIGSLVRAMDAGTMTNAEVRADLIKRIEVLQQARKNLLRRGTPTDAAKAKMQAVNEAINNLFGEIVSIDTTGSFTNDPGSKITPEAEAALQADLKGIQSRSAHDQALARRNSVKRARIEAQAARDALAATKKYKPDDEVAIRDAETKVLDAEAAERESIRDRSRALVDRAKSFARARHDSVGVAQLDVQATFLDLKAAQEEGDEAGIARAQGSIAEAVEAERQSRVNKIIQFMELGKALNSKGDTVKDSLIDRDIAQVRLNNATGDDVAQAMIDLKKAEDAIRQALIGRFNSLVELQKLENGDDPLADARIDLSAAQTMLALAQNEDEKINAQKQLLTAEKQIQDAMRDVRNSRYELRQAELTAMGDEVGASMTAAQLARAQLSEALQLANQGKGPGEAEINRLRAAVATADKAASDTAFQDKLDDYSFLYNMGQLTKSEYVNYLEGLKSTLIPGTKQFKDLELQIKQLKDDISGGLQMNLPTSLALPTLYEARRLNQIGESTGGNGTYNDSRTYNVIVNVDSSMSQADLVNALNNAMGNGVVGSDVRLY